MLNGVQKPSNRALNIGKTHVRLWRAYLEVCALKNGRNGRPHNTYSLRIDAMVGSPSQKKKKKIAELLVTNMVITYPTLTLLKLKNNVDIEMQVCDRHANEHQALKWFGSNFTGRKREWRYSMDRISKS